jgi:hypothetical protein
MNLFLYTQVTSNIVNIVRNLLATVDSRSKSLYWGSGCQSPYIGVADVSSLLSLITWEQIHYNMREN